MPRTPPITTRRPLFAPRLTATRMLPLRIGIATLAITTNIVWFAHNHAYGHADSGTHRPLVFDLTHLLPLIFERYPNPLFALFELSTLLDAMVSWSVNQANLAHLIAAFFGLATGHPPDFPEQSQWLYVALTLGFGALILDRTARQHGTATRLEFLGLWLATATASPFLIAYARYYGIDLICLAMVLASLYALMRTDRFTRPFASLVFALTLGIALLSKVQTLFYLYAPILFAVFAPGPHPRIKSPLTAALARIVTALAAGTIAIIVASPFWFNHLVTLYASFFEHVSPAMGGTAPLVQASSLHPLLRLFYFPLAAVMLLAAVALPTLISLTLSFRRSLTRAPTNFTRDDLTLLLLSFVGTTVIWSLLVSRQVRYALPLSAVLLLSGILTSRALAPRLRNPLYAAAALANLALVVGASFSPVVEHYIHEYAYPVESPFSTQSWALRRPLPEPFHGLYELTASTWQATATRERDGILFIGLPDSPEHGEKGAYRAIEEATRIRARFPSLGTYPRRSYFARYAGLLPWFEARTHFNRYTPSQDLAQPLNTHAVVVVFSIPPDTLLPICDTCPPPAAQPLLNARGPADYTATLARHGFAPVASLKSPDVFRYATRTATIFAYNRSHGEQPRRGTPGTPDQPGTPEAGDTPETR